MLPSVEVPSRLPNKWKWFAIAGILAAMSVASLWAPWHHKGPSTLRVGLSEFYPYIHVDESGRPMGLAVEVVQTAAERAGVKLQWIKVSDAERALRSGQIDLYPLLTLTDQRRKEFHFSPAWWEASQALLSPRDRPVPDPSSAVGKRIAIRDLNYGAAVAQNRLPGAILLRTRGTHTMIDNVCSGEVDGALMDSRLVYEGLLDQPPACAGRKLLLTPLPDSGLPMATASSPAAAATADRVFSAIEALALDGAMTNYADRWFVMPQQTYVQETAARRDRDRLILLFGLAGTILLALNIWHTRRAMAIQKAAECAREEARQAEERFKAFMGHTPAVTFIKDAHGRWTYVNDAFGRSFHLDGKACLGKTNEEIWPADVAAQMHASDLEVLRTGQPIQEIQTFRDHNGELRHWLVLKFPLTDGKGAPCLGGAAIEVTQQQRAAELVRKSEERYRALFEDAPIPIHELDSAGLIRRVNRAECELLGLEREDIAGRHASEFVTPETRALSIASMREKLAGRIHPQPFERKFQCKSGVRIMEIHETPIQDENGRVHGMRTFLIDLTDRHEAQARADEFARQLQKNNEVLKQALAAAQEATRAEEPVPGKHEPRNPYAHERSAWDDRAVAEHRAFYRTEGTGVRSRASPASTCYRSSTTFWICPRSKRARWSWRARPSIWRRWSSRPSS